MFLWLPTGYGKTICYQVPPYLSRGDKAAIFSGNSGVDKKLLATDRDVLEGKFRLLFTAPEAIVGSSKWKQLMLEPPLYNQIVALVVLYFQVVSSMKVGIVY